MPKARLNICPTCGKHGNVSWSGGTGPEFGTKSHGAWVVKSGISWGCLTEDEARRIFQEIEASSLPTSAQDADPEILWKIEQFMAAVKAYFAYFPDAQDHSYRGCHDFLVQPSPMPIPPDFLQVYEARLLKRIQK